MSRDYTGSVEEFFDGLAAAPHPAVQDVEGTIRIDVDDDKHWLLHIDHGRVDVSRRANRADAVITTDGAVFGQLVVGAANSMTAALRGQLRFEGDRRLFVAFGRLLPSPPGRRTTLPPVGGKSMEAAQAARAAGRATRYGRASTAAASMTRRGGAR
jgi:hypothetical protein